MRRRNLIPVERADIPSFAVGNPGAQSPRSGNGTPSDATGNLVARLPCRQSRSERRCGDILRNNWYASIPPTMEHFHGRSNAVLWQILSVVSEHSWPLVASGTAKRLVSSKMGRDVFEAANASESA